MKCPRCGHWLDIDCHCPGCGYPHDGEEEKWEKWEKEELEEAKKEEREWEEQEADGQHPCPDANSSRSMGSLDNSSISAPLLEEIADKEKVVYKI